MQICDDEILSFSKMNQYTEDDGQSPFADDTGSTRVMLNIRAAYPTQTIHEIASIAITTANLTLLRALSDAYAQSYLPIRWNAFIDISPTNMLLIFYDRLDRED